MKLLFKQRFFSWFDSYDIYDTAGFGGLDHVLAIDAEKCSRNNN